MTVTCKTVTATTATTPSIPCTRQYGDANGDGIVDYKDLAILSAAYGTKIGDVLYDARADFNNDGVIDFKDNAILAAYYGQTVSGYC